MKTLVTATGMDQINELFKKEALIDVIGIDIQSQEKLWEKLAEEEVKNADMILITEKLNGPFSKKELIEEVKEQFKGKVFIILQEPEDDRFIRFLRDLKITDIYTIENEISELIDAIIYDGIIEKQQEQEIQTVKDIEIEKIYIEKKVLSVIGNGGTGKTTVALNLAAALKNDNYNVCVLDLNLSKPDIGLVVGVEEKGLEAIKKEELTEKSILENVTKKGNISYFTGLKDLFEVQEVIEKIVLIIKVLRKNYDVVIIDCGEIIQPSSHIAITESDQQIVVFQNTGTHIKSIKRYLDFYENELKIHLNPKFIINKYEEELDLDKEIIEELLKIEIISLIKYDIKNAKNIEKGHLLINNKDFTAIEELKRSIFKIEVDKKKISWFKAVLKKW